MLSSKSFMVLALILLWSLIHFESVFAYDVRWGVQLHVFACGNPVVPAPSLEETVLSPLNKLDTLVKKQLAIYVWVYFWTLNSIPLVYMIILMTLSPCFDYYSFVVSFEIRKCESSTFILFQDCFGCSGSLTFLYEFKDWLFHFWKSHITFYIQLLKCYNLKCLYISVVKI